ncbi:MAG TPA: multicopper oxidase domain-containing protein [Usitatibacter sp.]|nr:multicopper oxidase domain-containing protein [Usitatibacter sp.]
MSKITRREFMKIGAGVGGLIAAPWSITSARAANALAGSQLKPFVSALPVVGNGLVAATPSGLNSYTFTMRQIARQLHPDLPATPLWAYDDGSGLAGQSGLFGMVVNARTGIPVNASFANALPAFYPPWIPVDTRFPPLGLSVRTLTHLHGGFVAGTSDGNPGVQPLGFGSGAAQNVVYPNQAPQQRATMLWFHDHYMGNTRLNVFAGLAGTYFIRDAIDTGTAANVNNLPAAPFEVPIVIQDRLFNTDGTMRYPVSTIPGVNWIGEYFGDAMLVNGKVWPFFNAEPRVYRFRILNACSARILTLTMDAVPLWQIGNECGLFDVPVPMKELVLAPAERADVLVDFRTFAGKTVNVKNQRIHPPFSNPANLLPTVMKVNVGTRVSSQQGNAIPAALAGGLLANLPEGTTKRFITLNEVGIDTAGWILTLNGERFDGNGGPTIPVNTTEDWTYINLTGDTHPIHVHLVNFQIVGRTPFDAAAYAAAAPPAPFGSQPIDPAPFVLGPMQPAYPEERGFKDTLKANPNELTTIRMKFELPAGVKGLQSYVQHCHILEHEDNDMMNAFHVQP